MIIGKGKNYTIKYVKADGSETSREIIPLTEVPKNIAAYDITGLNELQKTLLAQKQVEYAEYVKTFMSTMFDFTTWYQHSVGEQLSPDIVKFRTFTVDNIKELTENVG
jgi:hypothetical protein